MYLENLSLKIWCAQHTELNTTDIEKNNAKITYRCVFAMIPMKTKNKSIISPSENNPKR
jgi:hypothetical protein